MIKFAYLTEAAMRHAALGLGLMIAGLAIGGAAGAEALITAEEAALPDAADQKISTQHRSPEIDPEVKIMAPASNNAIVKSPIDLKLTFKTYGGTKVDVGSIKVLYLKKPVVDLTPRVLKYLQSGQIDMRGAEVPPGQHEIIIEFRDSGGHIGSEKMTLNVMK